MVYPRLSLKKSGFNLLSDFRCTAWLVACNMKEEPKAVAARYSDFTICSIHFQERDYMNGKKRLNIEFQFFIFYMLV